MTIFDPKKLGEEADELIRNQTQKAEEGDTPEAEETPELVPDTDAGVDDAIAQVESTTTTEQEVAQSDEPPPEGAADPSAQIAAAQKDRDAANQRWKVLQGMMAKKDAELDTMREIVANMNKQQTQEVQAPAQEQAKPLVTKEDIDEYGKDYTDFTLRAGTQAARAELANSQLLASMDARIKQLEGSVEGVAQASASTSQSVFFNELDSKVPEWRTLNNDASFLEWLDQADPYAGTTKMELLQHAVQSQDAQRAAKFFIAYTDETTPAKVETPPPSSGKESLVAPGKTKAAATAKDEPRVWTSDDISKLYDSKMSGKITAKEFDRLERDLFAAQAEGRIAA